MSNPKTRIPETGIRNWNPEIKRFRVGENALLYIENDERNNFSALYFNHKL